MIRRWIRPAIIRTEMKKSLSYIRYAVLSLVVAMVFAACSDEESFTSSPAKQLQFSEDTISFDTVFTAMGSSTQWLKVFNPNSEGVRLSSVRLASGGESGFYINVDGQSGTEFRNVEIAHKDSIFIFVEVNVDPTDKDSPVLIEDSIVFTHQSGARQYVQLRAYGQDVIILKDVRFDTDTTLSATRPYLIYDSLVVASGCTLTLPEGANLYFHARTSLIVHGTLLSQGTLEHPIMLRGDRIDRMFDYLPYDRLDSQWGGVWLAPDSKDNVLEFTDIHSGAYGVYCDGKETDDRKLTMTNSTIHNVAGSGLRLNLCTAYVANSQISNASLYCVDILGGYADFVHCTIAQFYPWKEYAGAVMMTNTRNDTIVDLHRASFFNCYITGRQEDEIFGQRAADSEYAKVEFNYHFENCVLATVIADDDTNFVACTLDTLEHHADNFRTIDIENYIYDFRLDSLSVARGRASDGYLLDYPTDRYGVERKAGSVDAGCYQY